MRYLMLIYSDEAAEANYTPEEGEAIMAAYYAFSEEVRRRGVMEGGEPLQPTHTATTVRLRGGKTVTSDGPFAETKEQLGGFYILNCKDLDEAIELAARIPAAAYGSVEIRPIMEFGPAAAG
jgi:hypothetical protein